jgi:Na+/phosphate symporter
MKKILNVFSHNLFDSAKDLAPIVLVIGFFQLVVLQHNIPNLFDIVLGTGFVLLGLTLFGAMVLKIAGELGLQVRIEPLILQELLECDEVFITNSVIGIKTVASIGEKFFTQQIITQKLIQIFKKIK